MLLEKWKDGLLRTRSKSIVRKGSFITNAKLIQISFFSLYAMIMIYGRSTHKDLDTIGKKVAIKIVKRNPDW